MKQVEHNQKNRNAYRIRHIISLLLSAVAILLLCTVIVFAVDRLDKETSVPEEDMRNLALGADQRETLNDKGKTYYLNDSVQSYLLIGIEDSKKDKECQKLSTDNCVADFLMLLVVDNESSKCTLLQLDQDTMTDVPVMDADNTVIRYEKQQLRTAFNYGSDLTTGSENMVRAVSKLLNGIRIDGYTTLTPDAIRTLNHAAGGAAVTVTDDLTAADPALEKGVTLTLTDDQAALYISEHSDAGDSDRTNAALMERQQNYMKGLVRGLKEKNRENSAFLQTTYDTLSAQLTTNIEQDEMSSFFTSLIRYESGGITTLKGETRKSDETADGPEHEEFYPAERSVKETLLELFYTEQ